MEADSQRDKAERKKAKGREYARRKYAALRSQGRCTQCGKPGATTREGVRFGRAARCRACQQLERERHVRRKESGNLPRQRPGSEETFRAEMRAYVAQKKARWKAAGKCTRCGKNRDAESQAAHRVTCYYCRKKERDARIRHRARHGSPIQQVRYGKPLPVGNASPYRRKGRRVWQFNIAFDDSSYAAWLRIKERHRRTQAERWGQRGTPGYREHVEISCQNSHLMRQTILTWRDHPCSRRQFFLGLNGYKVSVALDSECREIVERYAARYTNHNLTEAIRCMVEGCGVNRIVLGSRREIF